MQTPKERPFLIKYIRPISFVVILIFGYIGYLWWSTTPYHALRQVRRAIKMHDQDAFNKYVDVAHVVEEFTEDLIFKPAERTGNLGKFQKVVLLGALDISKVSINNTLIFQIQKWVARRPADWRKKHRSRIKTDEDEEDLEEEEEIEDERDKGVLAEIEEPRSFASILRREFKVESKRLKEDTYERMVEYARMHPDTLVNRIFVSSQPKRRNSFRKILRNYGFRGKNIRKVEIKNAGEKCICTLHFESPRTESTVPVHFELTRDNASNLKHYRITKIIRIKETFQKLGEDSDRQVQGLVSYGLKDLTFKEALSETKEFFKRVHDKTRSNND